MEVGGLAGGDADLTELLGGEGEDGGGEGVLAVQEREEAVVDDGGGLEGQLLVEDAAGEGVEGGPGGRGLEGWGRVGGEEGGQYGIGGAEVGEAGGELAGGG